jgi:hypothetical protein
VTFCAHALTSTALAVFGLESPRTLLALLGLFEF